MYFIASSLLVRSQVRQTGSDEFDTSAGTVGCRAMDVRLVQFAERHLQAFEGMLDDPDIKRFTRLPVPAPPGFPRTWLARYEQGRCDGTSEAFAIVNDGDEFLGCAMAFGIDADEGKAELGYVVAPAARGRGVAT